MPGGFWNSLPTAFMAHRTAAPTHNTLTPADIGGETYTTTSQVAVQNPEPLPHLQVGRGFRLRQSMYQAVDATVTPVPQTDDGCPFCLSYHLKFVCKSNCGGRHAHKTLSSHEQGVLSACKSRFCAAQPSAIKIAAPPWAPGGGSVGNTTISTRSRRYQGTRGTRSRNTKTWHTTPPPTPSPTPNHNLRVIN